MVITLGFLTGVARYATPAAIRSPLEVFNNIFDVFLGLGTLVGIVVISYALWKGFQYRSGSEKAENTDVDRPALGELPESGDGGRKLFVSFGISAIIVLGLLGWTYGSLLYVDSGPPPQQASNPVQIDVTGYQFGWRFEYPNGYQSSSLRIPANRPINFKVTSDDVFHNFGIPELGLKTDAIPGQTTSTWIVADETGTYQARCFELCGRGHSFMTARVIVMKPDAYDQWYASTANETTSSGANQSATQTAQSTNGTATSTTTTTATTATGA